MQKFRIRGCAASINWLRDQPFEQGMIIYIYIYIYIWTSTGDYSWEGLKFKRITYDYSWEGLKFIRFIYKKASVFDTLQKKHIKNIEFMTHGHEMLWFLRGSFSESELTLS